MPPFDLAFTDAGLQSLGRSSVGKEVVLGGRPIGVVVSADVKFTGVQAGTVLNIKLFEEFLPVAPLREGMFSGTLSG